MWWCIFTRKNETHGSRDSIRVHVCIKLVCACFVKLTCRTTSYYRIHMNTRDPIKTVFDREKNQWLTDISSWDGNTEYIFKLAHIYTHTHTHLVFYTISKKKIFSCTYKQNISLSSTRCDVSYFSTCCRWNRLITVLTHWWVGFLLKQFSRVSLVQHVHMRSVVV